MSAAGAGTGKGPQIARVPLLCVQAAHHISLSARNGCNSLRQEVASLPIELHVSRSCFVYSSYHSLLH